MKSDKFEKEIFILGVVLAMLGFLSYVAQFHNEMRRIRGIERKAQILNLTTGDIGVESKFQFRSALGQIMQPSTNKRLYRSEAGVALNGNGRERQFVNSLR